MNVEELASAQSCDALMREAEIKVALMIQETMPGSRTRAKRAVHMHHFLQEVKTALDRHRRTYGSVPEDLKQSFRSVANRVIKDGFGLTSTAHTDDGVEFRVRISSSGIATVMTDGVDWHKVGLSRRMVEERIEGHGK